MLRLSLALRVVLLFSSVVVFVDQFRRSSLTWMM